jgi:hypothetical protein
MGAFQAFPQKKKSLLADMMNPQYAYSPEEEQQPDTSYVPTGFLPDKTPEGPEVAPYTPPPAPSRLEQLQGREDALNAPPSTKNRILSAIIQGGMVGLGGIFGGAAGAAGAAEGISGAEAENRAYQQTGRNRLAQEIEAERNRQAELERTKVGAQSREDIAALQQKLKEQQGEQTLAFKVQQDKWKQDVGRQRASNYMQNIASLAQSREADTQLGRDRLKLQADNLQRTIDRDTDLDENTKASLSQQLLVHRENLAQRQTEEEGRNARTKLTQDSIGTRQAKALEKGYTPMQVAMAWQKAEQTAKSLGTFQDMTLEQQAELINSTAESFMTGRMPAVTTGEGAPRLGGILGTKTAQTVKPGAPVVRQGATPAPPPTAPTQNALPAEAIAQLRIGVNTTFANGQVWTLSPDKSPKRIK